MTEDEPGSPPEPPPPGDPVAVFESLAETYDDIGFVRLTANRLVELAALRPGEAVLDLATGTGWAALVAAEAVGPSGRVVATDLAEEPLAIARAKADARGLDRIEFATGDMVAPAYPDGSFDAVLCASALFFAADPIEAIRAWRRVLRPGGRVIFTSFGAGLGGEQMGRFWAHVGRVMPPPPPMKRFDAVECVPMLTAAGFEDVRVVEEDLDYFVDGVEAWWREVWAGLTRQPLLRLTPEEREAFRREHLEEVADLVTADGMRMPVPAIFAIGTA